MEADGVVREINGDNNVINGKAREIRGGNAEIQMSDV